MSGLGPLTDQDRIASLIRARPHRFGLPAFRGTEAVVVRPLGSGESYTAWLVEGTSRADGPGDATAWEPVVVRMARRPVAELPRPMAAEFQALAVVPAGIGPRPILLEESPDLLGSPFMVTTFVPGRHTEPEGWTSDLLRAHAGQLAALHAEVYHRSGRVGAPPQDRRSRVNLLDRFTDNLGWWRSAHPEVITSPDVAALIRPVRDRIASAAAHFERLRRFALVHGDLVLANILVDDAGVPRYVDWEWAEIGDPAQDLAYLGGPISGPSWYLPMNDAQVDLLLRTYLEASGTDEESLDSLRARRDAWEVYVRFLTSLHFRRMLDSPEDRRSGRYTRAVDALTAGLHRFLA